MTAGRTERQAVKHKDKPTYSRLVFAKLLLSKYKITGIIYIHIGMNELHFMPGNFHTKHSVFTASDAHTRTSLSYTL